MDRASIAHGKDNGNVCKILIVRPQCGRPLGRCRLRYPDNIKMDFNGISCEDVKWIHLHQDREGSNEPSGSIEIRKFLGYSRDCSLL